MQNGANPEENKRFWKASPTGELQLHYHQEHPLEVGAYYYVDMKPLEGESDRTWYLSSVLYHGSGGGEVSFYHHRSYDWKEGKPDGLLSGELKIGIDSSAQAALDAFGRAGTNWSVTLTFAEASDG